jgi:hypothetical protein
LQNNEVQIVATHTYSPEIDNFFYLTVASADIIVEEEIRIFDANSIVASIGGSLGLLIGFTFLQCLGELFNKFSDLCNKQNLTIN